MAFPVKNPATGQTYSVLTQQVPPPSRPLPPQGSTANDGDNSIVKLIGQTSLTLSADLFRDFIKKMPSFSLPTASAESVTDVDRLYRAARDGDAQEVESLLKHGIDINKNLTQVGTALYIAAQRGHLDVVKLLLKYEGININQATKGGFTPLHIAAQHGHLDVVKLLLQNHIDINKTADYGFTALHIAAQYGHDNVVQLLLNYAVDVNQVTKDGGTALHIAAQSGHDNVVKVLLGYDGININQAAKGGATALYIAAQHGHLDIVKLLLQNHIDINKTMDYGFTALHIAAKRGHDNVVEVLLNNKGININQVTKDGATALHLAAQYGHASVVELLTNFIINKGSDDERIGLVKHSIDLIERESLITLIKNMQDPNKRDAVLVMIPKKKLLAISKKEADARKIVLTWAITKKETRLAGKILEIDKEGWVKKLLPLDPRLQDEAMNKFLLNGDPLNGDLLFQNLHECDKQEIFKLIFNTETQYPKTRAFILNRHVDWYIGEIQAYTRMEGKQKYQELFNVASVGVAAGVGGLGVAVLCRLEQTESQNKIANLNAEKLGNQSQIVELKDKQKKRECRIGKLEDKKSRNQSLIRELKAEEENLKSRIGKLEDDIKKLKSNQEFNIKKLKSDQAAEKQALDQQVKELTKQVKELTNRFERYGAIPITSTEDTTARANLEAEISCLEAEVSKKNNHIEELQTRLGYLETQLSQEKGAAKIVKEQVEKNEKEKAAELRKLNKQLLELNEQIGDLNTRITDMDALLIKHDVHTKEQLAEDLEKALEIETELYAQPEITELDVSLGGDGWTRYLEVKHRNISDDDKRQELFKNCNRQYNASQQSVDQWGVLCIGTSHDDKSIKSLEKKCQANDYTFIDLTGKKPGEVVALIKNPHEKKPFFFIKKEAICKESMRYFEDEFPKQKYQQLVDHIATYNNEDNSQDSIDKRIHSFYSNLEIDKEKKYKLAGLLGEFWAVNFFTHLTKSVEDFSIKSTDIPIVASPASNDSGS